MDRKNLIVNSLVERKLTSGKKAKPICICMAEPARAKQEPTK